MKWLRQPAAETTLPDRQRKWQQGIQYFTVDRCSKNLHHKCAKNVTEWGLQSPRDVVF